MEMPLNSVILAFSLSLHLFPSLSLTLFCSLSTPLPFLCVSSPPFHFPPFYLFSLLFLFSLYPFHLFSLFSLSPPSTFFPSFSFPLPPLFSSRLASAVLLYLRHSGIKLRDSRVFPGLSTEKEKWLAFFPKTKKVRRGGGRALVFHRRMDL